jgi:hypothetical protein
MIVSKCLPWMWNFLSELLRIDGYNWIFNTWRYHKLNLSKIKEYITLVLPALPEAYTGLGNTFCVCPSFRNIFKVTVSDVSQNSSKTAKNTKKWFSRNISGKTCSQAICVWATLIQVNQDNSASVWWSAHMRNRFVDENVFCWKIEPWKKTDFDRKWLIILVLINNFCSYR